jgi:hypothetical protein
MVTITNKRVDGCIDVTSKGAFWQLSPFYLEWNGVKVENLWQYSKVYKQHLGLDGNPNKEWYEWRADGFTKERAVRYPMGKGAVPEYSYFNGQKYDYIAARRHIYIPYYILSIDRHFEHWQKLVRLYLEKDILLFDYDGYNRHELGMTLGDVVNCTTKKMGHAFVLEGMLQTLHDPQDPSIDRMFWVALYHDQGRTYKG